MTPRRSKNPDSIKYVSLVNGRYVYRPYIPARLRHLHAVDSSNRLKPPIKLGVEGDKWHKIVSAHAAAYSEVFGNTSRKVYTLRWCVEQYKESSKFKELSGASQTRSISLERILDHKMKLNGRPVPLGDLYPTDLTKAKVRTIRNKRLQMFIDKGRKGHSHCNREISFMSSALTWASEHFDEITVNPFKISKLAETKTDRYVAHDEYFTQLKVAGEVRDWLPWLCVLNYKLASRGAEALEVLKDDIGVDGNGRPAVLVERMKGSKTTWVQIDDDLQACIDYFLSRHKGTVGYKYLVPGLRGEKMQKSTVDHAMQQLKKLMADKGYQSKWSRRAGKRDTEYSPMFWSMHLIKAKGVSDAEDDRIAGHKSQSMRDLYNRSVASFKAPK